MNLGVIPAKLAVVLSSFVVSEHTGGVCLNTQGVGV